MGLPKIYATLTFPAWASHGDAGAAAPPPDIILGDEPYLPDTAASPPPADSLRGALYKMFYDPYRQWDFQFLSGAQALKVGINVDIAPAVALRAQVHSSESARQPADRPDVWRFVVRSSDNYKLETRNYKLARSPWSVEVGGTIPHTVTGSFQDIRQSFDSASYNARAEKFWEIHVAAVREWPLWRTNGVRGSGLRAPTANQELGPETSEPGARQTSGESPDGLATLSPERSLLLLDVAFGVSMLHIMDRIDSVTTYSGTYQYNGVTYTYSYQAFRTDEPSRDAFSPLFRVGLVLWPDHFISARVDAAYVGYANTVAAADRTFDLGFSGWAIRSMLQVRL